MRVVYGLGVCLASITGSAAFGADHIVPQPVTGVEERLLGALNRERAAVGVPPLRWNSQLAAGARSYGPVLASLGQLRHSARDARPGQSEALWRGTRGAYRPEQMIDYWADEKTAFRPGVFPSVSATGNWLDVAHYTTMVWPTTTAVGCAVHEGVSFDYLICRFSPRGNIDGRRVP